MGFRIAEGFVQVTSRFNEGVIRRGADRVGRRAGQAFGDAFSRESQGGLSRARRAMDTAFRGAQQVGREAGRAFGIGFQRDAQRRLRDSAGHFARDFDSWGRLSGRLFGQAFHRASEAGMNQVRSRFGALFRRVSGDAGRGAGQEFGAGFSRDANGRLHDSLGRFASESAVSGRTSGRGFASGFLGAIGTQGSRMFTAVGGVFSRIGLRAPPLMVGGIIGGLAALPAVGAAAAIGLTAKFGIGIAAIGLHAAAQSERVKKVFSDLGDHVETTLKRISKPFEGTLISIAGYARGLFDSLVPHLEGAFATLAPAIDLFAGRFLGALKSFGPVIDVAAQAFAKLLDPLGQAMEPAIAGLTDALSDLFTTVRDSPELGGFLAGFVTRVFGMVTVLVRVVDKLAQAYVWMRRFGAEVAQTPIAQKAREIGSAMGGAFTGFIQTQAPKAVDKARQIGSAIAGAASRIRQEGGPKITAAFAGVAPGFDGIIGKVRNLGGAVADRASDIGGKITGLVDKVGEKFREFRDKHAADFEKAFDRVSEIGRKVGETLGSAIDVVTTVVNRLGSVLGFGLDILTAVWGRFGDDILNTLKIVFFTVTGVLSGALTTIKGIFDTFVGIFTGDWSRAWDGIKAIFSGLWQAVLAILQGGLGLVVQTVKTTISLIIWPFQWLYDKIVGSLIPTLVNGVVSWFNTLLNLGLAPIRWLRDRAVAMFTNARDWIITRVQSLRDGAVSRFTSLRDAAVSRVTNLRDWVTSRATSARDWVVSRIQSLRDGAVSRFTSLRDTATSRISNLRDWVTSRASSLRDRVVSAFNQLKDRTISAFSRAADGVKTVFNRLRSAASSPVRFVIDVVYNKGIRGVWNNIAGKLPGVPGLPYMPIPKGFAKGGITDVRRGKVLSGFSTRDDQLAMVRSGEGILVPEAVRSLGAGFIHTANRLKNRAGELLLPGFRDGGIVGLVGRFLGKAKNNFAGGFVKALEAALRPMVNMVTSRFGNRADFPGLPGKMLGHLVSKSIGWLRQFADQLEGGDGRKVVQIAEKYVGLQGNPNRFTRAWGMDFLAWCGMFVAEVFKEAGAKKALAGVSWPPLVSSYTSLPRVSPGAKKAGDLALYRGDAGHINIYTGKGAITIGGNESNAVRKQNGYINSASSIRRPRFAKGGIVDPDQYVDLVFQDERENDWFHTTPHTRALREVMSAPPWARGTHDIGGVLPDGAIAVNRSGTAEVVQTLDQLRAIVEAAKGQHTTIVLQEGAIVLDASKIKSIQDLLTMIEGLRVTARQYGAKAGMP
ncbi:hypothetical protein [Actinomadura miaoliensis]|uniref:NlpC/P60 domain-containing protein n=1 Tax=Actinomadura miaoliensis TaxID=430685 RepID=A0ABP7W744_9ACTN